MPEGDEGFQVQVPVHAVDWSDGIRRLLGRVGESVHVLSSAVDGRRLPEGDGRVPGSSPSTLSKVQLMGDVCQREMEGFQV